MSDNPRLDDWANHGLLRGYPKTAEDAVSLEAIRSATDVVRMYCNKRMGNKSPAEQRMLEEAANLLSRAYSKIRQ